MQEAILLPAGQNGAGEADKVPPPKSNYQCEYKCASYVRMCEEVKSAQGDGKCTEMCEKYQSFCDQHGRCFKKCASTSLNCDGQMQNVAPAAAGKQKCMMKCTGWDMVCGVPDDISPIVGQMDDGSGGMNPFEPTQCLRTCAQWDSLFRCTKVVCNRMPHVPAEDADGMKIENVLANVECIGTCVTWNKFGTCVQWKCVKMESMDNFKVTSMQRGWWDDFWDKVKEWAPPAIAICSALGLCG